ncbi:hypothetical protein BDV93DRAFT_601045 [Ceratobasidium sp. AG-I]|nr:hypothetical protein BDV93DRAFT_601045 [Ceratobasidium sp. AG-I]
MSQNPTKGKRIRRLDRSKHFIRNTSHGRHTTSSNVSTSSTEKSRHGSLAKPTNDGHVRLAALENPSSTSFDMLSVESRPTSTLSVEPQVTTRSSAKEPTPESTEDLETTSVASSATTSEFVEPTTTSEQAPTSSAKEKPQQLQAEETSSVERTTLVVTPTFSSPPPSSSAPSLTLASSSGSLRATSWNPPSSSYMMHATTWTRPIPTIVHSPSASAPSGSNVQPPISHSHLSPGLIAFMVLGGLASLGLSLYVFKRVRYKALHVSRSQFQIPPSDGRGGPDAVPGSESSKSFVSGGLGQKLVHQKGGQLSVGEESPVWGGREKFSPQIGGSVVDFPPAAHMSNNSRAPVQRRSLLEVARRHAPGNRVSKYGTGWNAIPELQHPRDVPTVKITDMDTYHHRGGSRSSTSSTPRGSPDPNLATIQVASVTRSLSATASYCVGSPSSASRVSLGHPRPAPKVPTNAWASNQAPPVPRIPDIPAVTVTSFGDYAHTTGVKKPLDIAGRGKIAVTDISKPRPSSPVRHEPSSSEMHRTVADNDPMAMYTKYSVGLGVREDSSGPIRHENSMAKKIAQITQNGSKSGFATVGSQASLSNRDTRALAAAAGVGSPIPGEDHTFHRFGSDRKLAAATTSSQPPSTPGMGDVGNLMLRSFGESGSMVPAFLETPAIGPDGRSSYLSTNLGSEASWRDQPGSSSTLNTGPLYAIAAKNAQATTETNLSVLTLSPTFGFKDDASRRTITSTYSQDFMPLSQQAHMRQNPNYRSPTYSIYNCYGPDRVSVAPRMPSMVYGDREEAEIGGAL